jgi:hypothetical protein
MTGIAVDPIEDYRTFSAKCRQNFDRSVAEQPELHKRSIQAVDALAAWVSELVHRPEHAMLQTAVREMRFGILACAQGQYRQAYMASRMSLELSIAAIHFSAREIELREWESGKLDIKWSSITDEKEGVFSVRFTNACSPPLAAEASQVKGIAIVTYRECSDFVHGGAQSALMLPDALEFDEGLLRSWHDRLVISLVPITYAILARYARYKEVVSTAAAATAVRKNLAGIKSAIELIEGVTGPAA